MTLRGQAERLLLFMSVPKRIRMFASLMKNPQISYNENLSNHNI